MLTMLRKTICFLFPSLLLSGNQLVYYRPEVLYEDPVEICMLSEIKDSDSYEKSLNICKKDHPNSTAVAAFGGLSTYYREPERFCCTIEIGLRDRGYTSVFNGYSISNISIHPPLRHAFEALDRANMSILSIGDSTSSQMLYAIIAELSRKDGSIEDVTSLVRAEMSRTGDILDDTIYGVWKWKNVFIYSVHFFRYHNTEVRQAMEAAAYEVAARHDSLAIIANLGHHLADYLLPSKRNGLLEIMSAFLVWLDKLQKLKPGFVLIYKESNPSHFESIDGTYQLWKNPDPKQKRESLRSDSEFPLYNCKELGPSVQNRRENIVAKQLIQRMGFNFSVLEVFKYFKDYWKMHNGNCYPGFPALDCVHLCQYARPMWFPIWSQLDELIPKLVNQVTGAKLTKAHNNSELTADIQLIRVTFLPAAPSLSSSPVLSRQDPPVQTGVAGVRNFFVCRGIWHEIYTNQTLDFLRQHLNGAAAVDMKKTDDEEWELIGAPCLDSDVLVDYKVMLTTVLDPTVYIMTDGGKKAYIPSHEIFEKLGGTVTIPVFTIPTCQLDLIEETEFVLDDIISCGHKVSFLRVATEEADEVESSVSYYLTCNCNHHMVPDKTTMHFLHQRLQERAHKFESSHHHQPNNKNANLPTVSQLTEAAAPHTTPEINITMEERILPKGQKLADVGIPCISTTLISDGKVMLTTPEETTVYIITQGSRKARIPSYEIFQQLGGTVTVPMVTIPTCQLDLLEEVDFVLSDFANNGNVG